jgi:hypothetical protein
MEQEPAGFMSNCLRLLHSRDPASVGELWQMLVDASPSTRPAGEHVDKKVRAEASTSPSAVLEMMDTACGSDGWWAPQRTSNPMPGITRGRRSIGFSRSHTAGEQASLISSSAHMGTMSWRLVWSHVLGIGSADSELPPTTGRSAAWRRMPRPPCRFQYHRKCGHSLSRECGNRCPRKRRAFVM